MKKGFQQIIIISMICFACPGMLNALSGLGGGGKSSNESIEEANTAVAISFTLSSLFSVPIINTFGYKLAILAALTYALFVFSFLFESDVLTVSAGIVLGIGAGFLWNIQASAMLSIPRESEKGLYFSIFWMVFNLGALLGSILPLVREWSSHTTTQVSIGTYIGFIVIMVTGSLLGFGLESPKKSSNQKSGGFADIFQECKNIIMLFFDPYMLILIPLMAGSNWFYTYQFNVFNNGGVFVLRARALNNSLYWFMQIIGSLFIGFLLDWPRLGKRRNRALITNVFILVFFSSLWIFCIFFQLGFTRESGLLLKNHPNLQLDVFNHTYPKYLALYGFFGMADSCYQGFIYWLLGSMTNCPQKSARLGGFYKFVQNAAAAVSAQLDVRGTPYLTQLIICFSISAVGLLLCIPLCTTIADRTDNDDQGEMKIL